MTTTAAPATAPFRFFDVHVIRTRRLSPSVVRVTFGGERLAELASGGRDQRFKLFSRSPTRTGRSSTTPATAGTPPGGRRTRPSGR